MCGIAGVVFSDAHRVTDPRFLDGALTAIFHRGPDGEGRLVSAGVAAGMRRLSIIDLAGGDQPIYNETGTIGTLFNGEIYNFRELRELCIQRGHRFKTHSDTEVLVHLYEEFGDSFVERLDGMFGFLIWDAPRRRALIARDRYGVKPLYLHHSSLGLGFASEIKALAAMGLTQPRTDDPEAVADFLRYLWYPEPRTAWENVDRLAPGMFVIVEDGVVQPPRRFFKADLRPQLKIGKQEAAEECRRLLREAVRKQLVADVPVGAFLSGGLDSTLLVTHAIELGANVPTHTTRSDAASAARDPMGDDATFAANYARERGLVNHVHELHPDLVSLLPRLMWFADDPIADPTMINTFLICEAARRDSKVLLSGMGADEVAGGYRRHVASSMLRPFYKIPRFARGPLAKTAHAAALLLKREGLGQMPFLRRVSKALSSLPDTAEQFASGAFAQWTPNSWLKQLGLPLESTFDMTEVVRQRVDAEFEDSLGATMAFDLGMYLPSHNLHYVDKVSMAASVEVRVPYMDNDLAAFLGKLPYHLRVDGTVAKATLRRSARGVIADEVIDRPKTGFAAPIRGWLTGPLREMMNDYLSESSVRRRGVFDPAAVRRMIEVNERGVEDLAYPIWAVLSYELWCRAHVDSAPQAAAASV